MMDKEDLKGLQEQTITSRIVSSLINGAFLFILNLLIVLFVCFPILKNIPSYKENNENLPCLGGFSGKFCIFTE